MGQARRVLFIGYGYVAENTAPPLLAAGWSVSATTRQHERLEPLRGQAVNPVLADPSCEAGVEALKSALEDADAVISSVPPIEDGDPILARVPAPAFQHKRLIYLSTTGVYGDRQGGWAFERDALTPTSTRSIRRRRSGHCRCPTTREAREFGE